MKCAFLTGIKRLEIKESPEPIPEPTEILVRIKAVGICRSDIHYYEQGHIGANHSQFPQLLGHEPAGIVEKAPPGCDFNPGDRVAIEPGEPCFKCEHCLDGFYNRCANVQFFGSPGIKGAFSEYVTVAPCQLIHLPDSISMDEGALLEPLGIAFHALELASLKIGESVAVFGAGSIGLLTLAVAKLAGAQETFIFDRLQYRLDMAKKWYGVDHAVNSTETDPVKYIKKYTNERGVDIAIEAAGEQETFRGTFESARIGGRCYLIGIPDIDLITFDPHTARRRELLVQNVRRSNFSLKPCLNIVQHGKIKIDHLATHHFTLEKLTDAFELARHYSDGVLKAIITP